MRLIDIAEKIDKSDDNKDWVNMNEIASLFNVDIDYVTQDRLQAYWIGNWCCTDTWVGHKMYFLDDEPVAYSYQSARKSDERFYWFCEEVANKVKSYVITFINDERCDLNYCDIEKEFGDSFKINFNSSIINKDKAKYNSEKIEILERVRKPNDYGIDTELLIRTSMGEELVVEIENLDFAFNLIDEAK